LKLVLRRTNSEETPPESKAWHRQGRRIFLGRTNSTTKKNQLSKKKGNLWGNRGGKKKKKKWTIWDESGGVKTEKNVCGERKRLEKL